MKVNLDIIPSTNLLLSNDYLNKQNILMIKEFKNLR